MAERFEVVNQRNGSHRYYMIYDNEHKNDEWDDGEPFLLDRQKKCYTFHDEQHAECLAAALNLGWNAIRERPESRPPSAI
jgi:hypothetical protein